MHVALISAFLLLTEAGTSTSADTPPPFTDDQLDWIERLRDQIREELGGGGGGGGGGGAATPKAAVPSQLELKAEAYVKWLYRNNTSQGCVSYGNPHPSGDNYSGDNGACPEFALTVIGRPTSKIEGGFRLQSRYGQDFTDWFENGDSRSLADASSESLGQNHSAPIQLRAIYLRIANPLPAIDWFLAGSSDLGYWDPWTVGRVRFIDRFNAKGLFLQTGIPGAVDVLLARIALSKLFGTANYNSIEEDLVTNPFWTRDAIYALQIATPKQLIAGVSITLNGEISLDEEADARDPDAPGSRNTQDPRDEVTATAARFTGANGSLNVEVTRIAGLRVRGVFAASHNAPNLDYVTNLARGGLGFSNVVFKDTTDVAGTLRIELPNLLGEGRGLKAEYFNIGSDFNAVAGSRREDDVLLTDGLLDGGQLPTLNLANELIDFNDAFYETAIGWHGGTLVLDQSGDLVDFALEATYIDYNTDLQHRDMDTYPGFGGFTGFTDTDLFSYANTNDRGRDPRAVYARDQARHTILGMGRVAFKPSWWKGAKIELKAKLIQDVDLRNTSDAGEADDYSGNIFRSKLTIGAQPLDELYLSFGLGFEHWVEEGRSGTYAGGVPSFVDYTTQKVRPFIGFRYSIGPVSAQYHLEAMKKNVEVSDATQSYETGLIWRSVGSISAQF